MSEVPRGGRRTAGILGVLAAARDAIGRRGELMAARVAVAVERPLPPFHPVMYVFGAVMSVLLGLWVFIAGWATVGWALNRGTLWFEVPIVVGLMMFPLLMIPLLSLKKRAQLVSFAEGHGTDYAEVVELYEAARTPSSSLGTRTLVGGGRG